MALRAVERVEEVSHPTTARLSLLVDELAGLTSDALAGVDDDSSEADLVDQVGVLERLRGAVAAVQAAVMVRFGRARVERQLAADVHPRDIGRGVAEELGLACRVSPTVAARRLSSARAWWFDLPHTYAALAKGSVSEPTAEAVVTETRHLDAGIRREVDARLAAKDLAGLGLREATALARRYAYEADREAYIARGRHERKHRRVGLRPAPDTMSVLSGYLPVEQGVACLAALRRHTDGVVATGDDRSRDQIMADTLVERLTGQARATDVAVEIQLVVPADLLTDPDSHRTATVTGVGPLPGALAREIVDASRGAKTVRRLHATPNGRLSGIDPRRRFTGALADLVRARDQTCRVPFCGAPVRHLDHVRRHTDGGPTTLVNGRGLCARHNLVHEQPGWTATVVHDGLGDQPHTVRTTTPTGHDYTARAPDPP
ncbi:HNH endonuclease signature motif containing protein [Microlunatus antarcticus]|uniref:HNH nuclease domain-containing protein n=1 Tax=Microlunatus antarcticus TaxID=53388 RepID=A0A7W5JTF4_9ACTN|nr:DUF222 domain-containing protein [Microlunatus antarcticus]MBB3326007.1 hypothetical protein [Microlunatus antarcticus]